MGVPQEMKLNRNSVNCRLNQSQCPLKTPCPYGQFPVQYKTNERFLECGECQQCVSPNSLTCFYFEIIDHEFHKS